MGLFSKKEKSPEQKLVDELVGSGFFICDNLYEVSISADSKNDLQKIVKKTWKSGASVSEIQKVYDETLESIQNGINDNSPESSANIFSNSEVFIDFNDIPEEIQSFLEKVNLKPEHIYEFNEKLTYVVKVFEKLSFGITAHIYIISVDNLTVENVKDYASAAYNHTFSGYVENKSYNDSRFDEEHGGADSGPPVFLILILENISENEIPNLIPGDWAGQTNKAMIYDSTKKILYGKNGVHMWAFKKVLKKWGSLKKLPNNKKYFYVNLF